MIKGITFPKKSEWRNASLQTVRHRKVLWGAIDMSKFLYYHLIWCGALSSCCVVPETSAKFDGSEMRQKVGNDLYWLACFDVPTELPIDYSQPLLVNHCFTTKDDKIVNHQYGQDVITSSSSHEVTSNSHSKVVDDGSSDSGISLNELDALPPSPNHIAVRKTNNATNNSSGGLATQQKRLLPCNFCEKVSKCLLHLI